MNKLLIRSDDVDGFFARAKDAAKRADENGHFLGSITLSFADPQEMFSILSKARRNLMLEVMHSPKTIAELAQRLKRTRSSIAKDVSLLEKSGLLVSKSLPGLRVQKSVQAVAEKIELTTKL